MRRLLSKRWFTGLGVLAAAALSVAGPLFKPADVAAQSTPNTADKLPDAPPLKADEKDAAGVAVTFRPIGADSKPLATDTRVSRMLALFVADGAPPTPFLRAGRFSAVFEGDVNMRLRDTYTFSAEGRGKVTVSIGEKVVLTAEGDDFKKAAGEPVRLSKGKNKITVKYESPAAGDSALRLLWTVKDEYYAHPVPPTQLTHNAGGEAVAKGMRIREGRQLFAELHCFNCHSAGAMDAKAPIMPELKRVAPDLSDVGGRLSKDWMTAWINNPHALRPNPHMPRVFAPKGEDKGSIDPRAADVAAYLATLGGGEAKADDGPAPDDTKVSRGGQLFTSLNCIACHEPPAGLPENAAPAEVAEGETPPPARVPLKYVKAKFKAGALVKFLQNPAAHYASIPMPNFRFSEADASAVAAFLLSQAAGTMTADLPAGDAAKGKALIVTAGCVNCHAVDQEKPATFASLDAIPKDGWSRGCLSADDAGRKGAPHFKLTDEHRQAIVAFAATDRSSLSKESPAEYAMRQVKSLNCNACHARDGKESLMATTYDAAHKEMEGTYPPPKGESAEAFAPDQRAPLMTWFGEKLRPEWASAFIAGKVTYKPRPYLHAKMPGFNVDADALARGMAAEHGIGATTPEYPKPDAALAAIGSKLVGKTPNESFSCVQCHAVNKQPALNPFEAPAVNFSHARERLLKDYYHRWVHNPLRLDPNTKMPAFEREDGKTTITNVYEGDARKQFEAIWQYLLEGDEIKPPAE
ncbi:cytochrome c [Humisphaera borealis]|uniref:C-type cytochrome n=1 Tax=Humisphaera borealis TaxID=2807512 RepID=A0A7M2WUA1_9BACT|nr:c-type cytochrome [Humisphaera borealis]QOV89033.1 c-type cytochrome [Humisphaera borealis]